MNRMTRCWILSLCCVITAAGGFLGCEDFWNRQIFDIRDTGWNIVGEPAIASSVYEQRIFYSNSIPSIVYVYDSGDEFILMVSEFRNGEWVPAASPRAYVNSEIAIDMDPETGSFYLAESLYGESSRIYRLVEGEWLPFGPELEYAGYPESIAMGSDGDLFVELVEAGNSRSICRLRDSIWTLLGGEGAFPGYMTASSLEVSIEGDVFFGEVSDASSTQPKIYHWNGSAWIVVGSELAELSGINLEMAASPTGELYIIFTDGAVSHRLIARHWDGSTWETLGSSSGISNGSAYSGQVTISKDGSVFIFYADDDLGGEATVLQLSGTEWTSVGDEGFTYGDSVGSLSITTLADNTPLIAYVAVGHGRNLTVMSKPAE